MSDNPIMNIGDLAKPATTLIEKIADAGYILFGESHQIKKRAKAEAEATIIEAKAKAEAAISEAKSQVEITDLHRRAAHRWIEEEAQKQKNMENTTQKAFHQLNEDADPHAIDNDWIANFFDKTRLVSDDEMQELWARILAGEANTPNTFSKRTINIVSDLDKNDAELFRTLYRFGWKKGEDIVPIVFDIKASIYKKYDINFESLHHLESIKLIHFSSIGSYCIEFLSNHPQHIPFVLFYHDRILELYPYKQNNNKLDVGQVQLTKVGQELASICEGEPIEGFFEYVKEYWKNYDAIEYIR